MSSGKDPLNYINKRWNQGTTTASTVLKNTLGSKTYITDSNIREFVRLYVSGEKDKLPWDLRDLPIGKWYVVYVKNMSKVFKDCTTFNESLAGWDMSQTLNMDYMFENCSSFNQPIGSSNVINWYKSKVTSMKGMFKNCELFNQDVSQFTTSNVTNMSEMFYGCKAFQGVGLETWNIKNVTNMSRMFYECESLILDLNNPANFTRTWEMDEDTDLDTTDIFVGSSFDIKEAVVSFKEKNLQELPIAKPAPLNSLSQFAENITSLSGITPKINTAELIPIGYGYYDADENAHGGKKRKTRKGRNGRKSRTKRSRKSGKKSRRRRR
jgi:surface protein